VPFSHGSFRWAQLIVDPKRERFRIETRAIGWRAIRRTQLPCARPAQHVVDSSIAVGVAAHRCLVIAFS
jgi:hypothetical protein